MATLDALLRSASVRLAAAGIDGGRVDAELLAAHALGLSRGEVLAAALRGTEVDDDAARRFAGLVEQRAARRPLQHLTGRAPFRALELAVGPGVFVPRPETEVLAGLAVAEAAAVVAAGTGDVADGRRPGEGAVLVVDLCTGSGAVALSVADEVPQARVVAVEREAAALEWAARNVSALPAGARVELRGGDVVGCAADGGVLADLVGVVDVVVANPPYIPAGMVPVDPEVADHDPHAALYGGGEDGLEVPTAVVEAAAALLRPGGLLLMEHADVQGAATRALAAPPVWTDVRTAPDLTGRDRVLAARRATW